MVQQRHIPFKWLDSIRAVQHMAHGTSTLDHACHSPPGHYGLGAKPRTTTVSATCMRWLEDCRASARHSSSPDKGEQATREQRLAVQCVALSTHLCPVGMRVAVAGWSRPDSRGSYSPRARCEFRAMPFSARFHTTTQFITVIHTLQLKRPVLCRGTAAVPPYISPASMSLSPMAAQNMP